VRKGIFIIIRVQCETDISTMRVNSRPRGYNGTQSAFADTNGNDVRGRDAVRTRTSTVVPLFRLCGSA